MSKRKHIAQDKWSAIERQSFADGVRMRAGTVPDARRKTSKQACRQAYRRWREGRAQ